MWFVYALITTLAWGIADLFYKKGADDSEKYTHLKTAIMVGAVMGIHAIITLITKDIDYNPINMLVYLPVSLMYIISMIFGYFGLRYLELSISSPIQNSSGAVCCLLCLIFLGQKMDAVSAAAVIAICLGVFLLGVFEKQKQNAYVAEHDKKYKIGFVAFLMPILYCIIDSLGTFFDAYYLDDFATTPLVGATADNFEDVANISYELTFLICGIIFFIYIKFIKKEKFGLFAQKDRAAAALFETAGQATYVYAMSGMAVVAAPMIASYSIVSLILSRIFLKEKLSAKQYVAVAIVMLGIAALGLAEGLAE